MVHDFNVSKITIIKLTTNKLYLIWNYVVYKVNRVSWLIKVITKRRVCKIINYIIYNS